ncbi:MAG: glycosyltransferase family 4 protein [Chloroflexi bacterium]|nr:glycosyltransferase family 4 protein [Chloroflexota bacterium]
MRILVLNHEFPPVGGGGGEATKDVSFVLAERGYDVTILTAHVRGLPKTQVINGVKIYRLQSMRKELFSASFLAMAVYIWTGLWYGLWLTRRWKPDLMHAQFAVPAGALAWILSRILRVPYIITAHLGDVPGGVPEKTDRWFRWVYPFTPRIWRDARQVVAVSEFTRGLALRHYPVDIRVIPNGVDLALIDHLKPVIHHPPQIVFSGRFVAQKNPVRVVEVLDQLRELEWHCTMMGDGILKAEVEREIAGRGLTDRFTLTGWVEPNRVVEKFKQCDILFMPSHTEAFPVTGVLALASGLAIVASHVSGYVDMVEHGVNGFIYESEDVNGMREGLKKLVCQPEILKSAREQSLQKARHFDIKSVADEYESLFQEILPGK